MGLFGKKDEQQPEIQNEEEITKKPLPAPRAPRKKKDPIQPWTKKERLFILGVLIFTVLISAVLALSAREWKLPGLPQIQFKLPQIASGTIVLEGQNKNLNGKEMELITKFKKSTDKLSGKYGFYVLDLKTGADVGLYENEVFQAASLIKVPVMVSLYQNKPSGYQDLVLRMGKKSDNQAFREARRILGDKTINSTMGEVGMTNTSLEENDTTMTDMALIFKDLYENKTLNEKDSQAVLDSMKDTLYEEHLVSGVPSDIEVSHKYGLEIHVVNDGGIVYADNPYIVIIMTKGVVESEADEVFPELSRIIYEWQSKQ